MRLIYLYTDFGSADIYVGQIKTALLQASTIIPQVDLLHDAPAYDIVANAHLLDALAAHLPGHDESIFLVVVDPGVGSDRHPVVLCADGRWYVGPDNGLLSIVAQRAAKCQFWEIVWRPDVMSDSFHGRDLFAPIVAKLAANDLGMDDLREVNDLKVMLDAADLSRVVYIDHYGNVMTGMRRGSVPYGNNLSVAGTQLAYARIFAEVPSGTPFWYENSIGLLEIAVNGGHAADRFGLKVGDAIEVVI